MKKIFISLAMVTLTSWSIQALAEPQPADGSQVTVTMSDSSTLNGTPGQNQMELQSQQTTETTDATPDNATDSAAPATTTTDEANKMTRSLALVALVLSVVLGIAMLMQNKKQSKAYAKLHKETRKLADELEKLKHELAKATKDFNDGQNSLYQELEKAQKRTPSPAVAQPVSRQTSPATAKATFVAPQAKPSKKPKSIKYCTFLVDEKGMIRTERRAMSDNSGAHLFKMEYDEGASVATYTINPANKAMVLNDLETFKNFTEQFSILSRPNDVDVIEPGELKQEGNTWVVTKRIKVSFK